MTNPEWRFTYNWTFLRTKRLSNLSLSLSLMLWPTVSRPVCLGIKHPSGAYDKICITVRQLRICWCMVPSLSFTIAAGARQRSHSRVGVPWNSRPNFTVSDSRLSFSSPPTTCRAAVVVFDPASESSRVGSYVTTDGQSASLSWNKAHTWGLWPDIYYCQTVASLLMWGALSDERSSLSFAIAAGPRQRSHSRVRVPWNSRHILLSQIRGFAFPRLLWLARIRWRY
jgi:hypothetical protein